MSSTFKKLFASLVFISSVNVISNASETTNVRSASSSSFVLKPMLKCPFCTRPVFDGVSCNGRYYHKRCIETIENGKKY